MINFKLKIQKFYKNQQQSQTNYTTNRRTHWQFYQNQIKNREKKLTRLASGSRQVWELCESDTALGLTTTGTLEPRRRKATAGAESLSPEKMDEADEMARAGGRRKGVEGGAPRPGLEGQTAGVESLDTPTAAATAMRASPKQLDSGDDWTGMGTEIGGNLYSLDRHEQRCCSGSEFC